MTRSEAIARLQAENYQIQPGQKVTVGPFEPRDALGVTRCYYQVYGGSFPLDHVYLPDELIRRSQSAHQPGNEQHMFVARAESGDIVGLGGIFRSAPGGGILEVGQLMVLKSYRMTRVAVELCRFAIETLAPSLGLNAVYSESLCNHVMSQKLATFFGLEDHSLELDVLPPEAFESEQQVGGRVALLQQFRVYQDIPHTVYLPPAYGEILQELYDGQPWQRTFAEPAAQPPLPETSQVHFSKIPDVGFYRFGIETVGRDIDTVLAGIEQESTTFRTRQAQVNLADPAAAQVVDALFARGYRFGGLLPLWFNRDALFLQQIDGAPHWDGVHVKTPRAHRILDLIRKDWERR